MKVALFLLRILADRARERGDEQRKNELRWRGKSEALEAELPEPPERTVEQWESLVAMAGELYYAIAASSNGLSFAKQVEALVAALEEAGRVSGG